MKKSVTKILFILSLLIISFTTVNAQSVHWAKKGSSQGFDNGNGIATDDSGNVYITGQIEYTAVFDSYTVSSYGIHDILVAKYSPDGILKWIHSAGGTGGDVGNAIGVDGSHYTYISGEVETTGNFGSGITLTSAGSNDVFLAKYNLGGQIMWAKRFGSAQNDKSLAMAVTSSGDCFMTGYFSSTTSFGGTSLTSNGGRDIFVVKTNSNGTVQWAKKAGGGDDDRGNGIAVDNSGNIFVTGTFTQSATFNGTTITNSGNNSTFLAKYNASGQLQWARASGACCDTTEAHAIAVDENGNAYIAGHFNVVTKFGSHQFNSMGSSDIFIVKYDPSGNVVWAKRAGGVEEDIAYGVAVDTISHLLYVTGSVWASGNFDTCSFVAAGFKDIFIAAYDLSGNALWVKTNGGGYRDVGSAICVDRSGYIFTTGLFNDTAHFDSIILTGYPNQPWADFYADKISASPVPAPTNQSTSLIITNGQCSDLDISLTPGNGSRRIIVAHEGSAVFSYPVNGYIYSADSHFGNGSDLGNNNYVVYDGSGNNVIVTGLLPGVTYYFSVFEYNGIGASINYLITSPLSGNATTATYTINIAGLQNSICIGDSLSLLASGGLTYFWSPSTGLSATTGPAVIAKPQSTTTYLVSAFNSSGCQALRNFTINVNLLPAVGFPNLSAVCVNDQPFALTTGTPAGGIYSGNGVSGGQFNPASAGVGTYMLLYEYTDTNGCANDNQASIIVKPLPSVSLSTIPSMCENGIPVTLNNGNPSGGIYSGTGVNAGIFDPTTGHGTYIISYSFTGANGCTGTDSVNAIVNTIPIFNLGADTLICGGNSILLNAGAVFSSYAWSNGATGSSVVIDSSGTGLGIKTVSLVVSNTAGCLNSDTIRIIFDICNGITIAGNSLPDISVYPNPFYNSISLASDKTISLNIYDISGRLIEKKEHVNGYITVGENLCPGIYFIEVFSGLNKKIIPVLKSN